MEKLDILAFGAHPDDIELSAAGTILLALSAGQKVALVDLTRGELGTRGTLEKRKQEAFAAQEILGVSYREQLGLEDGNIVNDAQSRLSVIQMIRKYQPEMVLCNALYDRHPDHGQAGNLVEAACFESGLLKRKSKLEGKDQKPWRPKRVLRYIQDRWIKPDIIFDITEFWPKKMESILAHKSQFYNAQSQEEETYISSENFLKSVESRAREFGRMIFREYGEGFSLAHPPGLGSLSALI